ncbi:MAG: PIG-L deacetylase family protein [Pseudonocardiaceae bacterium]
MSTVQRVLAVSPHLDDAALSAGATLADLVAQGADVQVVTLFAGVPDESLSAVARVFHANCGLPENASAFTLRLDEDQAAMDELGARPQHCGFLDAIYRRAPDGSWLCGHDRAMFDDLPLDQNGLLGELSGEIGRILAAVAPDLVLTCAAMGNHIDHRLTRAAALDAVSGTEVRILLWEDIPYAINHSPITTRPSLTRTTPPGAWERKWRAIARYTSQVRMLWSADADWIAELFTHATIRGDGRPAELFIPPTGMPPDPVKRSGVVSGG